MCVCVYVGVYACVRIYMYVFVFIYSKFVNYRVYYEEKKIFEVARIFFQWNYIRGQLPFVCNTQKFDNLYYAK